MPKRRSRIRKKSVKKSRKRRDNRGKIRNPKTGRYVKKSGIIGKKLLAKSRKKKSKKKRRSRRVGRSRGQMTNESLLNLLLFSPFQQEIAKYMKCDEIVGFVDGFDINDKINWHKIVSAYGWAHHSDRNLSKEEMRKRFENYCEYSKYVKKGSKMNEEVLKWARKGLPIRYAFIIIYNVFHDEDFWQAWVRKEGENWYLLVQYDRSDGRGLEDEDGNLIELTAYLETKIYDSASKTINSELFVNFMFENFYYDDNDDFVYTEKIHKDRDEAVEKYIKEKNYESFGVWSLEDEFDEEAVNTLNVD